MTRERKVKANLRPLAEGPPPLPFPGDSSSQVLSYMSAFPLYHDPRATGWVLTPAVLSSGHHKLEGKQPHVSAQPYSLLSSLEQATGD